jgi:hypothetical protein
MRKTAELKSHHLAKSTAGDFVTTAMDSARFLIESRLAEILSKYCFPHRRFAVSGRQPALLLAYLGNIDLADYLHSNRSPLIGCSNFLKFFHDTSTLELSQRFDHSLIKSASILGRRIVLPESSADSELQ